MLAYGFPGMAMGAGLNSDGIALCWTSANLDKKPKQSPRVGVPSYMLIAHLLAQSDVEIGRVAVVERDPNVVSPSQDVQYRAKRVDRNPESVLAGIERPPGLADTVKTNAVDSAPSDVELCALLVQRAG